GLLGGQAVSLPGQGRYWFRFAPCCCAGAVTLESGCENACWKPARTLPAAWSTRDCSAAAIMRRTMCPPTAPHSRAEMLPQYPVLYSGLIPSSVATSYLNWSRAAAAWGISRLLLFCPSATCVPPSLAWPSYGRRRGRTMLVPFPYDERRQAYEMGFVMICQAPYPGP